MGVKVLVVGAQGQLGQALQQALRDKTVLAHDIQEMDITDRERTRQIIIQSQPDAVVNAAAYTNVDGAESDETTAYQVNARGPQNLAQATEALGIPLVHVSTDYVFDGLQTKPYHEFDETNPQSVYGKSKLAGEEVVRSHTRRHFIVRTAWLFHTVGNNFPKTICRLAKQSSVRIVNDQFGSPTYAPHLAKAIEQLLGTQAYGTYHLAGSGGTSWYGFARELFAQLHIQTPLIPITTQEFPRPAPRPPYAVLTTRHDPPILLPSWEQGVKEFANAYAQEIPLAEVACEER